ncbi:MAG: carbohydrate ABC transporter permease [bacterium]
MTQGRGRVRAGESLAIGVLIAISLVYLLGPLVWMAVSSVSPDRDLMTRPLRWIPVHPTSVHYRTLFQLPGASRSLLEANPQIHAFLRSVLNSFIIATATVVLSLGLGSISAYSISRFITAGQRSAVLFMLLATRMVPVIAVLIPIYMGMQAIGLLNTLQGLILVDTGLLVPFVIWIMEGFYRAFPIELEEAAVVDGCGPSRVFFQIVAPLSANALFASGVFVFIATWSDFIVGLVLTNTERAWPISVVLAQMLNPITQPSWGLLNGAALIAGLVPAALALVLRNTVTRGILAGALKG